MEKYYIPEIKEFYVGFEYEYFKEVWNEVACDLECDPIEELRSNIKENKVRVKYLDKEDIESLEFTITSQYGNYIEFEKEENNILKTSYKFIYNENKKLSVEFYNGRKHQSSTPLFWGIVNNKSEFKKLMKMLNIK